MTDHRINYTIYKLDNFLNGDIDELINKLISEDQAKKTLKILMMINYKIFNYLKDEIKISENLSDDKDLEILAKHISII